MMGTLKTSGIFRDIDLVFAEFIRKKGGCDTAVLTAAVVSRELADGHACMNIADESPQREKYGDADTLSLPAADAWNRALKNNAGIIGAPGDFMPLIHSGNRVFLQRYYSYETGCAQRLKQLAEEKTSEIEISSKVIKEIFAVEKEDLDSLNKNEKQYLQIAAAQAALQSSLMILSGGPGTGKTTVLAKILGILYRNNPDLNVTLAAPTGKAAMRMNESLKDAVSSKALDEDIRDFLKLQKAMTIHRLLGTQFNSTRFRHNRSNPLSHDVVVIDEASMVDIALMYKLVSAVKDGAKLILIGDKDQLASVEAGSVLTDLCEAFGVNCFSQKFLKECNALIGDEQRHLISCGESKTPDTVVHLQRSYRFSSQSGIGKISSLVNSENDPEKTVQEMKRNSECMLFSPPDNVEEMLYTEKITENYVNLLTISDPEKALQELGRFMIIAGLREGNFGVNNLNETVERMLIEKKMIKKEGEFYDHRPIMITSNDYSQKLFNGDTGILLKDELDGRVKAWFAGVDGTLRSFLPTLLPPHATAWAMTVHKSQGSEYDSILMVLPAKDSPVLSRELIYTGITRARKQVRIAAKDEIIAAVLKRSVRRVSGLVEAIRR